jgi:hypothetical protein
MRSNVLTKDFCVLCTGNGQIDLKSLSNAASAIILRTSENANPDRPRILNFRSGAHCHRSAEIQVNVVAIMQKLR